MHPPIESIQYLLDVFIEGGYAMEEDLPHLNTLHKWLRDEREYVEVVWSEQEEWEL